MRDEPAKQSGDFSDPEVMVVGVRTRSQSAKGWTRGIGRKCGTRTFGDIVVRNCM